MTLVGMKKSGSSSGWTYDQPDIGYDDTEDTEGREVKYDQLGTTTTLTAQAKIQA